MSFKNGIVLHLEAGWGASLGLVDIHSDQLPTTGSVFVKHLQDKEGDESEHLIENVENSYFMSPASTVFMLSKIGLFMDLYLEHESFQLCSLEH